MAYPLLCYLLIGFVKVENWQCFVVLAVEEREWIETAGEWVRGSEETVQDSRGGEREAGGQDAGHQNHSLFRHFGTQGTDWEERWDHWETEHRSGRMENQVLISSLIKSEYLTPHNIRPPPSPPLHIVQAVRAPCSQSSPSHCCPPPPPRCGAPLPPAALTSRPFNFQLS